MYDGPADLAQVVVLVKRKEAQDEPSADGANRAKIRNGRGGLAFVA
jgi:hypothetical protein